MALAQAHARARQRHQAPGRPQDEALPAKRAPDLRPPAPPPEAPPGGPPLAREPRRVLRRPDRPRRRAQGPPRPGDGRDRATEGPRIGRLRPGPANEPARKSRAIRRARPRSLRARFRSRRPKPRGETKVHHHHHLDRPARSGAVRPVPRPRPRSSPSSSGSRARGSVRGGRGRVSNAAGSSRRALRRRLGIRRRRRRRARGRRGRTSLRELRERADNHLAPRGGAQLPPRRPGGVAGRARTSARTSRRGRPRGGARARRGPPRRGRRLLPLAPTSAASAADPRLGSALAEAAKLREGAEREQAREREQTREREPARARAGAERGRTLDPAASEGTARSGGWRLPPPLARVRVDGGGGAGGSGTPPEPCGSNPATPGARTPAHSYPATPKRAGEDEEPVGGLESHPLRGVGDDARASAEFSGGPGGIPRLRCRGGEGGCVLVVVHLRDFHRAAGFQLGTQRAAMRLAGGFHALCHYLRAYSELEKLWVLEGSESAAAAGGRSRSRGEGSISTRGGGGGGVARDAPGDDDLGADDSPGEEDPSSRRYPSFGADGRGLDGRGLDGRGSLAASTLANLLGAETAASVDVTALDALLERRGYAPRAGTERPPPRGGYDAFDETSRASRWSDDESCAPSSRASSMSTTTTVRGGRDDRLHPAGPGSVATSVANSARGGGAPVEVEAMELAPGETIRFRSAAAAALIVERGSLEGYWNPPDAADHGARASVSGGAPTRRGSGERRESARSRRSSRGERSSRGTSGDGGYLRDDDRGDPRGVGKERGSDRDRERGSLRGRDRDRDRKSQPRRSFPKPSFVAGPGSAVGAHLLLTGQRSATILRAGPSGAVVAALPYSAVARLARADPGVHSRVAASLARRLRGSLIARAWDRCGTEWTQLEAGQSLAAATVGHAPARTGSRDRRAADGRTRGRASREGEAPGGRLRRRHRVRAPERRRAGDGGTRETNDARRRRRRRRRGWVARILFSPGRTRRERAFPGGRLLYSRGGERRGRRDARGTFRFLPWRRRGGRGGLRLASARRARPRRVLRRVRVRVGRPGGPPPREAQFSESRARGARRAAPLDPRRGPRRGGDVRAAGVRVVGVRIARAAGARGARPPAFKRREAFRWRAAPPGYTARRSVRRRRERHHPGVASSNTSDHRADAPRTVAVVPARGAALVWTSGAATCRPRRDSRPRARRRQRVAVGGGRPGGRGPAAREATAHGSRSRALERRRL